MIDLLVGELTSDEAHGTAIKAKGSDSREKVLLQSSAEEQSDRNSRRLCGTNLASAQAFSSKVRRRCRHVGRDSCHKHMLRNIATPNTIPYAGVYHSIAQRQRDKKNKDERNAVLGLDSHILSDAALGATLLLSCCRGIAKNKCRTRVCVTPSYKMTFVLENYAVICGGLTAEVEIRRRIVKFPPVVGLAPGGPLSTRVFSPSQR